MLEVSGTEKRSNTEVFKLIREMGTVEDRIYSDVSPDLRSGLTSVLGRLEQGDILIVRSLCDVAEDTEGASDFLAQLKDKGAELYSCQEPFLNGSGAYDTFFGVRGLLSTFAERKKAKGYSKARAEGRVGRPSAKAEGITAAIALYTSGTLSIAKIEEMTGVSKSTIYKYLKKR